MTPRREHNKGMEEAPTYSLRFIQEERKLGFRDADRMYFRVFSLVKLTEA